jgi:hypothetical protein
MSAVCVQCGRVYTVCPQYISPMPEVCRECGGMGIVWRDGEFTCQRCEGDGWDTPLEGCCDDCGEEEEHG